MNLAGFVHLMQTVIDLKGASLSPSESKICINSCSNLVLPSHCQFIEYFIILSKKNEA